LGELGGRKLGLHVHHALGPLARLHDPLLRRGLLLRLGQRVFSSGHARGGTGTWATGDVAAVPGVVVVSMTTSLTRENSLYDTPLKCVSLFDTRQLFLPYMTSCLNFFPPVTLKCIFLTNGVKERHEKTSLPLVYNMTKKFVYITILSAIGRSYI
jgi:hypothetical protein